MLSFQPREGGNATLKERGRSKNQTFFQDGNIRRAPTQQIQTSVSKQLENHEGLPFFSCFLPLTSISGFTEPQGDW